MAAAASPGSCSSTSSDWIVLRDGCLRCDEEGLRSLTYHPALNAILAVTSRGSIKVIDGTSGAILQASALHGEFPPCGLTDWRIGTVSKHGQEKEGIKAGNTTPYHVQPACVRPDVVVFFFSGLRPSYDCQVATGFSQPVC